MVAVKEGVDLDEVISTGLKIDQDYWKSFTPVSQNEIVGIEKSIEAKLPLDFKEFYSQVGWNGEVLSGGGGILSPERMVAECSQNISFVTGSLLQGNEWASEEEHEIFWKSNGKLNPKPEKFTDAVMNFYGVPLWHLLSVGFDGIGSAINVYC